MLTTDGKHAHVGSAIWGMLYHKIRIFGSVKAGGHCCRVLQVEAGLRAQWQANCIEAIASTEVQQESH